MQMPRHLEMPRPFRLCSIGMSRHMTGQLLPIHIERTARIWALLSDATRLEPAVHAGLTHLEPPSRFGLSATATHKIHHPLTQVDRASHAPGSPKAIFLLSIGNCGLGYTFGSTKRGGGCSDYSECTIENVSAKRARAGALFQYYSRTVLAILYLRCEEVYLSRQEYEWNMGRIYGMRVTQISGDLLAVAVIL